jgi:hypothetical protein
MDSCASGQSGDGRALPLLCATLRVGGCVAHRCVGVVVRGSSVSSLNSTSCCWLSGGEGLNSTSCWWLFWGEVFLSSCSGGVRVGQSGDGRAQLLLCTPLRAGGCAVAQRFESQLNELAVGGSAGTRCFSRCSGGVRARQAGSPVRGFWLGRSES